MRQYPAERDQIETDFAVYPPMDAALRAQLAHFFAPHNLRLADYAGRTFPWQ